MFFCSQCQPVPATSDRGRTIEVGRTHLDAQYLRELCQRVNMHASCMFTEGRSDQDIFHGQSIFKSQYELQSTIHFLRDYLVIGSVIYLYTLYV